MKKLLALLLKLIGRAKVADLDNDGKIETLNEEIQGVLSQFKIMSDKLEENNSQLIDVIQDEAKKRDEEKLRIQAMLEAHERKMEESEAIAEKAQSNIEKNNKIKAKVDEFVVD